MHCSINKRPDRARYYRSQFGDQPLPQRMKQLVELRRREGYMAECEPGDDRRSWLLREFHCSVARIAEHFPMVCDQELHLYRSAFPDCRVERVHWMRNGDHYCGFRLEEQLTDSQPPVPTRSFNLHPDSSDLVLPHGVHP